MTFKMHILLINIQWWFKIDGKKYYLYNSLEDVLECNVDVVTTGSNNKDFLENISKDVVLIYEK